MNYFIQVVNFVKSENDKIYWKFFTGTCVVIVCTVKHTISNVTDGECTYYSINLIFTVPISYNDSVNKI